MSRVVCFDFDDVIVKGNPVSRISFLIKDKLKELELGLELLAMKDKPKKFTEIIKKIMLMAKGIDYKFLENLVLDSELMPNSLKTFKELKKRRYKIVIISTNDTKFIKKFLAKNKLLKYIDFIYGSTIEAKNGKLTGRIYGDVVDNEKLGIVDEIKKKYKIEKKDIIYIGDGLTDMPIILKLGFGILFCPNAITRAEIYENRKIKELEKKGKLKWVEKQDLYEVMKFIEL